MRYLRTSRAQLRLWALMTMAFVIVGICSGIAIFRLALDQHDSNYRDDLRELAAVAALSLDAETHQALTEPNDMDSEGYRSEIGKLAEIKSRLPNVKYIYTLTRVNGGYAFILDPTPPGDHDHDGVEDKSYLGDAYPEVSMQAKTCFEQGKVTVEHEPTVDRWGTFISAYAPIRNKSGDVVAILGIDRLANDLLQYKQDLFMAVTGGLIMILLMGGFFGWAFTRKLAASTENRGWLRYLTGSNRIFRATILEVVLGSLALVVFLGAVHSLNSQRNSIGSLNRSLARRAQYEEFQSDISTVQASQRFDRPSLRRIKDRAQAANIPWIYERLGRLLDKAADDSGGNGELQSIVTELDALIRQERLQQEGLQTSIEEHQLNLGVLFFVSAFLALGTLAIVRTASIQQQDLIAAQTDSEWHQVAYRQVVENLPIGLYMYAEGEITFSNDVWDTQCQRSHAEDRLVALRRSMVDQEPEAFFDQLKQAAKNRSSLECQYKLLGPQNQTLILDSRAVPLFNTDGEFECLLGFTVDVTQRARIQDLLRGKNREVQSKNRMLSQAVTDLEDNFEAMVQTLVKAVEAKDPYTAGHSERVMQYSMLIGGALRLPPADMKILQMGTLVHDIGKIGIPDEILTKPDQLTDSEYRIVQAHAENGARMVENIPTFQECVPIIRGHHERLNGTGYPNGLRGNEIPLLVRIASVADVFDALTSDRAYRSAVTLDEAIQVLASMAEAGELDPKLVKILTEIVLKDGSLWSPEANQAA